MEYRKIFIQHYVERFSHMSAKHLVEVEQWLSRFIDSDMFSDSILSDEAVELYEAVRNECVKRVSLIVD